MDTSQWAQGIGVVKQMENPCSKEAPMLERRARPQKDQALNCPRRYWTEGGSLRNVPVGGGSRKNKRSTPSSPSPSSSQIPSSTITKNIILNNHDLASQNNNTNFPHSASQNPKIHQGQDLNLAYPPPQEDYNTLSKFIELPYEQDKPNTTTTTNNNNNNNSSSSPSSHLSAMELLKTGIVNSSSSSRGLNSTNFMMPMSISESSAAAAAMYNSTGFANLQDFKPGLNFSVVEGFENGYGGLEGIEESGSGARMLFPVEEMKQQVPSSDHEFDEQNNINTRNQGDSSGFWNGMLGGGSW
ncbi:dof zinc finger protein 1-like isoform X2 [Cicer arietinum]|uniref:Dof zinc finger protein DOF4.6-like isoform X2 n=1 Tax=Cicer arietinum TaxID=3827 RepID=A0A1S2YC89_CICAR|nr:dof zinc finger protein DOF4.6-like isoform X2 [Cicer arietinum]